MRAKSPDTCRRQLQDHLIPTCSSQRAEQCTSLIVCAADYGHTNYAGNGTRPVKHAEARACRRPSSGCRARAKGARRWRSACSPLPRAAIMWLRVLHILDELFGSS